MRILNTSLVICMLILSGCAGAGHHIEIDNVHSHIVIGEPITNVERIMKDDGYSVTKELADAFSGFVAGSEEEVSLTDIDYLKCQRTEVKNFVSTTHTIAFVIDEDGNVSQIVTRWDSVGL